MLSRAASGVRTRDLWLGKRVLYQLSYCRIRAFCECKDTLFFLSGEEKWGKSDICLLIVGGYGILPYPRCQKFTLFRVYIVITSDVCVGMARYHTLLILLTTLVRHYVEHHLVGAVHCFGTDACEVAYRAVDIVVDDALYGTNALALHRE